MASYLVKKAVGPVDISAEWDTPVWSNAVTQKLEVVFDESSSHHPETKVRMVYDDQGIYGLFQVKDQYVHNCNHHWRAYGCRRRCDKGYLHQ